MRAQTSKPEDSPEAGIGHPLCFRVSHSTDLIVSSFLKRKHFLEHIVLFSWALEHAPCDMGEKVGPLSF